MNNLYSHIILDIEGKLNGNGCLMSCITSLQQWALCLRCCFSARSKQKHLSSGEPSKPEQQLPFLNTSPSSECHYLLHRLPPQKTTNYKDTYKQLPPSFVFLINQVGRKINCLWADVEKVMISWELSRIVGSCRKYSILKALRYLTRTDHATVYAPQNLPSCKVLSLTMIY